jgi:RND family efflux transporter MFP subunit
MVSKDVHTASSTTPPKKQRLRIVLVLFAGAVGTGILVALKPKPEKSVASTNAPLVTTVPLVQKDQQISIQGFGTVFAERTLEIRPQVSGHIVGSHPNFYEGGVVPSGETLITIDPRDYELLLASQKATLAEARAALLLEQGNQIVAEKEWSLIGGSIEATDQQKNLALRKPQLAAKQAALTAAESMVKKAELDLARTSILAPYDCIVQGTALSQQQFVSPQASIGQVTAIDRFLVKVKISNEQLRLLSEHGAPDSPSVIRAEVSYPGDKQQILQAEYRGLSGSVDVQGGSPEILLSVPDPLGRKTPHPPLLLGSYVAIRLLGRQVTSLLAIPRNAARENQELWLLTKENTLHRTTYSLVFSDEASLYVTASYPSEAKLITSFLPVALDGLQLQEKSAETADRAMATNNEEL